jgi:xanthine dehydrogenase accessory factor
VIASKKRFRQIMQSVNLDGISQEKLDSIRCPAGLDIPARTLQEVALSIVAEIVSIRRRRGLQAEPVAGQLESTMVEDPVCHMTVDARTTQTTFQFESVVYYFCSTHCNNSFEKNPRKYISVEAKA